MTRVQYVLIGHGHTTSKVLAPPQDLASGVLVLQVLPGRIGRIHASNLAALPGERTHQVGANPAGAAGDEGGLARNVGHSAKSFSRWRVMRYCAIPAAAAKARRQLPTVRPTF